MPDDRRLVASENITARGVASSHTSDVEADRRWLAATWPFVRASLPPAPGRAIEIGCGDLGGFVPDLRGAGYDAVGVDPEAPTGPSFRRTEFERYDGQRPVDAIIACTSLHHVGDLHLAVDKAASALDAGGVLVVVEWAHEAFDEATARWCFDRLPQEGDTFLHRHRDAWADSGLPWSTYFQRWARVEHGLHSWTEVESALATRFTAEQVDRRPYYFPTLGIPEDEEAAAIQSGAIRAGAMRYLGRLRN
jgi:SAM-dependent methyltransferase